MTNLIVEDFKSELMASPSSFICSKWIFDRIPHIFNEDRITFIKWKEELAAKIGIDSKSMVLTGSASCGFSLNPYKNYRLYNEESDVDVAIISELYFDIAWKELRNLGTKRFDLTPKQKASLKDHVDRLIYWGTIATDKLLELFPFGKQWALHLLELARLQPINNKVINIRLYKDFDSLRDYHINNLEKLKLQLFENTTI